MKTVFSNAMTIHTWAQQCQPTGRNSSGSIFFEGRTVYSYGRHFPMATFEPKKPYVVFVNSRSYSNVTSEHQTLVKRSLSNLLTIFTVPVLPTGSKPLLVASHKINLKYYQEQLEKVFLSVHRALRQNSRQVWLEIADKLCLEANLYAETFNRPNRFNRPDNIEEIHKTAQERDRKDREKIKRKSAGDIKKWRAGSSIRLPYECGVLLRVKGERVESSQGATCYKKQAAIVWPFIAQCKASSKGWAASKSGKGISLGVFKITKIRADGSLLAGCHDIPYKELKNVAKELGLLSTPSLRKVS